uniref:Autophagy related 2B n=1 Tax=Anser brachyrhynchus TaxID=132585 RepID=A0A8B9BHT9_9AVES
MPWPFSESIKKRACRYLLQRYLGHFLQEKLSLEQLSLDLYQGTGSLTQVPLDKWCLNEILESADAPLEVTDGFIQSISLSVPWGSLLQDNCALEVKGLEMVFRPRPRLASGSEPMYWSSFMTSSMQLAKECLSQKLTDEQGEGSQPFEGLEKFAETIETVLRRVKVTFLDTVLRVEHVPENSKSGTALEIRIERTMYCDETADECSGINVHQPTAFAHKLLQLSGVCFFWDEFPASTKSSPVCSATQFIGTGIKVSYEQRQRSASRSFSTDLSIGDMEFLECLFSTDSHSIQPHYTEVCLKKKKKAGSSPKRNLNSFTEVFLDDSHAPANCRVSVQVTAPALNLSVRFPIPDLRSDQERGPWFKKSLQKEILHLEFTDMEFKTEFIGGSTPEQVKLELTFKELTEDKAQAPIKFFQVSGGVDGDMTSSDNFDWPRIVLKINPLAVHSILERIAAEEEEGDGNFQEEEEGGPHSLKDVCDIRRPEPSPFSSRRVMFENEEMVMPGDIVEMTEFQDKTINNSHYVLELMLPNIHLTLPNKSFYEKLYNRQIRVSSKCKDNLDYTTAASNNLPFLFFLQQDDGNILEGKYGEFWFEFNSGSLFSVTKYEGFEDRHYVCLHSGSLNLYHQGRGGIKVAILYFLNISDEPVLGYNPPATVTTFHVHLWSCALDYRPLFLPVRSLLTVETFSISSSVAVDKSSSTLRIILDEAALHLSDKCNTVMVNLHRGKDLFNLTTKPRFELHCSSDVIHIRTCSDSCAALMNLIQYIASYGDLHPPTKTEIKCGFFPLKHVFSTFLHLPGVLDDRSQTQEPSCSDLFLFPDESGNASQDSSPTYASFTHHLINEAVGDVPAESDDFCILFAPKVAVAVRKEEPVIKKMVDDAIIIRENHFSQPIKKTDTSKAPLHFPVPLVRYVVKEISLIWHLYGGRDFGTAPPTSPAKSFIPHSSPSHTPTRHGRSTACGGRGRNPDFLMEIQLSKVKFQHEVYPPGGAEGDSSLLEQPVSRQVFIVQDLEIRDRLATSQMNKFLYLYCSKEMPRKAHSNMLTVKALHVRPESGRSPQECCLRVSLMPLRLNIDQDALFFLKDFFTSLSTEVELLDATLYSRKVGNHGLLFERIILFLIYVSYCKISFVYLREFRFTSEVPIRLDYHGKHVSMDQGTLAGILIGLAQLNCSELKLKRLCYRHGLLGVDKLFSYAISEWLNDIKKNQLPGILGGVGPMHSLVQLVQGLKDLVWLPIEQYRKDGRIVRGFQRGAASFGTSTAMAALELTNRMVQTIQAAAETAYDMVSPGPTFIETKKIKRFPRHRLAHQPVDLREGVAKAYSVVKEGITDTAQTIYETAAREHENRGVTGAVGGVLRQIPPTVVKPFIVATEATSNVLGGMRNQIRPDVRQEESQKWRLGED